MNVNKIILNFVKNYEKILLFFRGVVNNVRFQLLKYIKQKNN